MAAKLPTLNIDILSKQIEKYNPKGDIELVKRAYSFAEEAHGDQKRLSGDPYTQHLLHVAKTLVELKLDTTTIAAGLLHDTIEDTPVTEAKLEEEFGEEIAYLVASLTKIGKINFKSKDEETAENIRKVILATSKDIRVILIKLADRLHNMRTLRYHQPEAQVRIAKETRDIYAPIAHKLGIYMIKAELEDLAFKHLEPEAFQEIKAMISEKKDVREEKVKRLVQNMKDLLKKHNIPAKISGRRKGFWSIYNKIHNRGKAFEDIKDLLACRIIVKDTEACYKVMYFIHENWKQLPQFFGDYIANPKPNGYQSIHTKVLFEGDIAEVQIRSLPMHQEAEAGIAAHWRYKKTERDKKFDQKIAWLKQILEWKDSLPDATAKEFIDELRLELFKDEIIAFTPKGEPITLPEGSTPVDFAYAVHTKIGDKCARAKVNGELKPLDAKLNSGDVVEIITQNNATPSRTWLQTAKTAGARSKIRKALGIEVDARKSKAPQGSTNVEALDLLEFDVDAPVRVSRCCELKYGEPVSAFLSKDGKISAHNAKCSNVASLIGNKEVPARWVGEKPTHEVEVIVTVDDQVGVAALILGVISAENINISSIRTDPKKGRVNIYVGVQLKEAGQLEGLLSKLRSLKPVQYVAVQ